ncbi:MAG TPA: hypothetical protein VIC85_19815 [Ktedonobacterales bacterium]|jgi:hypothetical protein
MTHAVYLSDAAYEALRTIAAERGESAEAILEAWVAEFAKAHRHDEHDPYTNPRYFTTDEFLRHLGMSDEEIQRADELAARDNAKRASAARRSNNASERGSANCAPQ